MANNLFSRKKGIMSQRNVSHDTCHHNEDTFCNKNVAETADTQLFPASSFTMPFPVSRICAGL